MPMMLMIVAYKSLHASETLSNPFRLTSILTYQESRMLRKARLVHVGRINVCRFYPIGVCLCIHYHRHISVIRRGVCQIVQHAFLLVCQCLSLVCLTAYIVENAEKMQINPTQIITSGSSAGAITALQAEYAISNQNELTKILPEGFKYAGAMSFAGAIFSVDGKLKWGKQPAPIALFHGNADRQVPYDNESILGIGFYGPKYISKQMSKAKWAHWFYDMEYQGHNIAGQPMFENHNEIKTFIKEYALKRRPLIMHTVVKDGNLPEAETKFKLKDYIEANFGK